MIIISKWKTIDRWNNLKTKAGFIDNTLFCDYLLESEENRHAIQNPSEYFIKQELDSECELTNEESGTENCEGEFCNGLYLVEKSATDLNDDNLLTKFKGQLADGPEFAISNESAKRAVSSNHCKIKFAGILDSSPVQSKLFSKRYFTRSRQGNDAVTVQGRREYCCGLCKKSFTDMVTLEAHRKSAHLINKGPYACDVCTATFRSQRGMKLHMKNDCHFVTELNTWHAGTQRTDEMLSSRPDLRIKDQVTVMPYLCDQCCASFCGEPGLKRHKTRRHNLDKIVGTKTDLTRGKRL